MQYIIGWVFIVIGAAFVAWTFGHWIANAVRTVQARRRHEADDAWVRDWEEFRRHADDDPIWGD